jgi:hypothetical protein
MNTALKSIAVLLTVAVLQCSAKETPQVTISVDRSEPIWLIRVTNHGVEPIEYEMINKVPRGLGIEFWSGGLGRIVHAENLAELLYTHGNPADMRKIEPGGSADFKMDPRTMSAEEDDTLERWSRAYDREHYDIRVFFGDFASARIFHSRALNPIREQSEHDGGLKGLQP